MRIAWIVPGGVDPSGRERIVPCWLWLLERIAAHHQVVVFVAGVHNLPRTYELLGATVVDLGRPRAPRGFRLLSHYRALLRLVRQRGPFDVAHGFWGVPGGILAANVARRIGIPSLVTFDSGELVSLPDIEYGLQRNWRGRLQVRLAAARASRVTVCTDYMRDLARTHGIDAQLAPFGIDAAALATERRRPEGPPWRLLHVASLNHVKDQPTLLHGFARIVSRIPDAHLDIVGEDTLEGAIQSLASRIGVGQQVTFHGFQPTDRLRDFYARAHLFIQSSRHEAAGIAVVEAAASGVPTVGTRVGHVADWSPDAALGVSIGDAVALGDAVVSLLEDCGQRERMATTARLRAAALHADRTAMRFEALYQSAAESPGADRLGSRQTDRSR